MNYQQLIAKAEEMIADLNRPYAIPCPDRNLTNVQHAIDVMGRVVDEGRKFNMGVWYASNFWRMEREMSEEALHSCGTSACALGWMASTKHWRESGGKVTSSGIQMFDPMEEKELWDDEAGAWWLGLPKSAATALFFNSGFTHKPTLDAVLDNGSQININLHHQNRIINYPPSRSQEASDIINALIEIRDKKQLTTYCVGRPPSLTALELRIGRWKGYVESTIPIDQLVHKAIYQGEFRQAYQAQWDADSQSFLFKRAKAGFTYDETAKHFFADQDGFRPIQMIG